MRAGRQTALLLVAAIGGGFVTGASAHRRDEYLQAARIGVEPDRVHLELELTPGIAVADEVIRDIDRDGDGRLSPEEQQAYARRVLRNVELGIDSGSLGAELVAGSFPEPGAIRSGEGIITLEADAPLPVLAAGSHHLFFRNTNDPALAVYLANALAPDNDRLAITAQERDSGQRELTIEFVMHATPPIGMRGCLIIGILGSAIVSVLFARRARLERARLRSSYA